MGCDCDCDYDCDGKGEGEGGCWLLLAAAWLATQNAWQICSRLGAKMPQLATKFGWTASMPGMIQLKQKRAKNYAKIMAHSALELSMRMFDALCPPRPLHCTARSLPWHLATLKRFQLLPPQLPAAGCWLPQAHCGYKSAQPAIKALLCKNYCNSHHLECILIAIEWPSNA